MIRRKNMYTRSFQHPNYQDSTEPNLIYSKREKKRKTKLMKRNRNKKGEKRKKRVEIKK